MYIGMGWRARIGHLYASGALCDYELQLMAPDGVQVVTSRIPFDKVSIESDKCLAAQAATACDALTAAAPNIIAVNCTSAGAFADPTEIVKSIEARAGVRTVTTLDAVMAGLTACGGKRLALLSPYPSAVVEGMIAHFARHGITVVTNRELAGATAYEQSMIPPDRWVRLALETGTVEVDAILFSCSGIQIAPAISIIERLLGVPVVTSNQALMWHCLRALDISERPRGYGQLLAGTFD